MPYTLNIRGHLYTPQSPLIMGILNLTPDSFYAQSRTDSASQAVRRVEEMLRDGMDILDIGAVSTRPGFQAPSPEEEWQRLEQPLKEIVKQFPDLIVSLDTFRSETARRGADCGAGIINDVSGGAFDKDMFCTAGRLQLPYILTHNAAEGAADTPHAIIRFFSEKVHLARMAGIHDIIIDPGFGFGKTLDENYKILAGLQDFSILNLPLLAGVSRKSMLYKLLDTVPEEALNATTAAHMLALVNGADILRVHDIKPAAECVKIFMKTHPAWKA